jgi:N-acylneuraminate cytidylyltransferase
MKESLGEIVGFIPARGGSKGIPNKNICDICGRPLIYYVLDSAIASNCFKRIFVSTDCDEIKKVIHEYNSEKVEIVHRKPELATDSASTESVLIDFAKNNIFDWMFLIQATSPLVNYTDFQKAINILKANNGDTLLSTVEQKRFVWRNKPNNQFVEPVNYNPQDRSLRQQITNVDYIENGAFYAFSREGLLKHKCRLYGKIANCTMGQETYWELDSLEDKNVIEKLIRSKEELRNKNQKSSDYSTSRQYVEFKTNEKLMSSGAIYI